VPQIDPRELCEMLSGQDPPVLLDVREASERELCRIPVPMGGREVHIPLSEFDLRGEDALQLGLAAQERPLVVYCHHGVRSAMVVDWLIRQGGRDVRNLNGGIDAYAVLVDPEMRRY
jgi:rhodanese-related sulfurtransferase